jgi:hypothetical protein
VGVLTSVTAVLDDNPGVGTLSEAGKSQLIARLLSPDFDEWSQAAARVGHCSHPVRLRGSSVTVDQATGEVLSSYASADEPDGVTRIKCGNRRESVCPACSREYAADTWHLIAAGAAGGKGVPETVAQHPMVFTTLTAPSFGPVHIASKPGGPSVVCRGRREKKSCAHGRPAYCFTRHQPIDPRVGQPLCAACYDYDSHIIWQWHAPELWRRFTIALRRAAARRLKIPAYRLGEVATVQFAKVAEYQRRGSIHFHALIRLDGPKTARGFAEPPDGITAADIAELVRAAASQVRITVPGVDKRDPERKLAFGGQLDAQPVKTRAGSDELNPSQVAGYIAKYATKSVQDADLGDDLNPHIRQLRQTVIDLARRAAAADLKAIQAGEERGPYELLRKWAQMLGFRGHFSSKSRKYSTTLGSLRSARRRWQTAANRARRNGAALDLNALDLAEAADEETTLVIGSWEFVGIGWANEGETALATAAAARARELKRERAARRHSNAA